MSEITFSIRPATSDDLDGIMKIEKKSYQHPWKKEQFAKELENKQSTFLVYTDDETDEEVAGYIVFWNLGHEIHILNVAVGLEWRGLGMGTKLVRHAINEGYRCKLERVILEVRVSNKSGIALYKKIGFESISTRKKFYSDGEDALQMSLNLLTSNVDFSDFDDQMTGQKTQLH